MTEVEAAVRQLGKAIQADPRYQAYWKAKTDNDADTELQENIQAFNLKKMSYQHETEKLEENRNPEKLEKLETDDVGGERCLTHFICRSWKTRTCRLLILPSRQ